MYTITLKDGTKLKDLVLNGNNYISSTQIDESLLTYENLSRIIVNDGEKDVTYNNMKFIQQVKYDDGYYFVLIEMTDNDKLLKLVEENTKSIDDIVISMLGE